MRSGLLFKMQAATLALGLLGGSALAADIEVEALQAMMQAGKVKEAAALLDAQLARDQKNFQLRYLKALTLLDDNQSADAVSLLNDLIRDFPRVAELYNNRGVGLTRLKQYSKALQDFEEAIRLKADYLMAHENLGVLHASLAELAFAQAMQLDRNNTRVGSRHAHAQSITGESKNTVPGPAQTIGTGPAAVAASAPAAKVTALAAPASPQLAPPPMSKEAPRPEPAPLAPPPAKIVTPPVPASDSAKVVPIAVPARGPMDLAPPAAPVAPVPAPAPSKMLAAPPPLPVAATPESSAGKPAPVTVPAIPPAAPPSEPPVVKPPVVKDVPPSEPVRPAPRVGAIAQPIPTSMLPPSALSAGSPADQAAVKEAVEAWRAAWAGKNTKGYFAAYSPTFVPTGLKSFNEWRADREKKVGERTETISITMNDMVILFRDDGLVDVRYSQVYRAGMLEMLDRKYLLLSQKGGRWLIEQEKILVK